jgi:exopolysaccharide biosynthesis predicted pyruvyltransferase EpsI
MENYPNDAIQSALTGINAETINAFDWLTSDIDRRVAVTFVPNPGNIGDAAINLACFYYLNDRFARVDICPMTDTPRTECVFLGGGGNAVEPLYNDVRNFLDRLPLEHRLFVFPATIRGYSKSLLRVAPIARILCRELTSYTSLTNQLGLERVWLTHDAAFLLAPRLRRDFTSTLNNAAASKCYLFRTDKERVDYRFGGNDMMSENHSYWTDMGAARNAVWAVAHYFLNFGEVETDRLHGAILAAILGRQTILRANCYYKNAAVFNFSLSRLPNTTMSDGNQATNCLSMYGLKGACLSRLQGLRRSLEFL